MTAIQVEIDVPAQMRDGTILRADGQRVDGGAQVGDDDGAGEGRVVGAAEVDQCAVTAGDGIASTRATVGVFAFMTAD
jgi:hypothetical protein